MASLAVSFLTGEAAIPQSNIDFLPKICDIELSVIRIKRFYHHSQKRK
jgi:hypothetical protein